MNKVSRVKNENFTVISNVFLKDKNLSLKAKGFLAVVMGLPSGWEFSINGVCSILKEGKTAIYNVIDELKENGYCSVVVCRDGKGRMAGNDYTFYEEPQKEQPCMGNPNADNQPQLSTNSINNLFNKELEDKKESKDESLPKKFSFKQALLDLGVCESVVNDFLLVRKNKKATNSETAFNRIKNEIAKSGLTANECITIAVEHSWQGFSAEWVNKTRTQGKADFFRGYTPQKISDRADDYLRTLKVDIKFEQEGVKYLKDDTFICDGKRYYRNKFGSLVEVPIGLVARPNENWEYNKNSMVWVQDERTMTTDDFMF